jgi:hypothetical protein
MVYIFFSIFYSKYLYFFGGFLLDLNINTKNKVHEEFRDAVCSR